MDFAEAITAFFVDPLLTKDAVYIPKDRTESKSVRVITKQPDVMTSFGDAQIHSSTNLFDVQAKDVLHPQVGDHITVDGVTYQIQSEPKADRERIIWTLDVVPL